MLTQSLTALAILLAVFTLGQVNAQSRAAFSIHGKDQAERASSIQLGVDVAATNGYDPPLGEYPVPPIPPVPTFDLRLVDPVSLKRIPPDGSYKEFRPFRDANQVDTFVVFVRPEMSSFPVQLRWDADSLNAFAGVSLVYFNNNTQGLLNMKRETEFQVTEATRQKLIIITKGPKVQPSRANAQ